MDSVSGWYPDPAGQAQFRFWDGQNWTTATAPAPAAEQVAPQQYLPQQFEPQQYAPQQAPYQPQHSQPVSYGGFQRAPEPRRSKRLLAIAGGAVAAVAIAAVGVPLALGAGHTAKHPTTAALKAVLLSRSQVGAVAQGTFTIDNSDDNSDDSSDDSSSADCAALSDQNDGTDKYVKADASTSYADSTDGMFVSEDLSYTPGKAAELFTKLTAQLRACSTLTIDGATLHVGVTPAPFVSGSDDTFALEAQGLTSGRSVNLDFDMARFGDTCVFILSASTGDPAAGMDVAGALLRQAAAKAKGVM